MSDASAGLAASEPTSLFLELWHLAIRLEHDAFTNRKQPSAVFRLAVERTLKEHKAEVVSTNLIQLIDEHWPAGEGAAVDVAKAGLLLEVMRAIDLALLAVHPRSLVAAPSFGTHVPDWLGDAGERRLIEGDYARDESHRVIPRGPLLRSPRDLDSAGGFSLPDSFSALGVAPLMLKHDERDIRIAISVVTGDLARGIPRGWTPGAETILFIPLAEAADDLVATIRTDAGKDFLDITPGASNRVATALNAITDADRADIAMIPELVLSEAEAGELASELGTIAAPRMTVAGSGLTDAKSEYGKPWNEARVFNAHGAELWRQRKVWPYGMSPDVADAFDFKDRKSAGQLMEDVSAGTEIHVADVETLGRCVILICQDFEANPLAPELIRTYQPDWVFVPILDTGTDLHRWPRLRAFNLAPYAQTRILVVSSLTMTKWLKDPPKKEPPIGLASGPAKVASGSRSEDNDRQVQAATCESTTRRFATLTWRTGSGWLESIAAVKMPS